VDQLPDLERKLPNFGGFELPFFDFGPFDSNLGPEFDLSHFDRSFFELPEAGLTMISTISRLEGEPEWSRRRGTSGISLSETRLRRRISTLSIGCSHIAPARSSALRDRWR
jgi:hypothetical protein